MIAGLSTELEVRAACSGDAPAMAALMVGGNSTYADWAPRFWRPPSRARTQSQWNQRLREEERWTRLALDRASDLVALASWCPGREHGDEGAPVPGVGYVSHLYVHSSRWGHGIARGLLDLAQEAMRRADIARAVLWTPERAPARDFYERCGWRLDGRERWSTELQLPMVGYEKHL
jgi:GNAT superfamily N-acetyltransferase